MVCQMVGFRKRWSCHGEGLYILHHTMKKVIKYFLFQRQSRKCFHYRIIFYALLVITCDHWLRCQYLIAQLKAIRTLIWHLILLLKPSNTNLVNPKSISVCVLEILSFRSNIVMNVWSLEYEYFAYFVNMLQSPPMNV